MTIDYKKFIEENFMILGKDSGTPIPFKFTWVDDAGDTHAVQEKYYKLLKEEYGEDLEGVREIVLKARQEGMSSFVLALFATDFILRPYSVSICISHRKDSTDLLFKKVKFYLDCYLYVLAKKTLKKQYGIEEPSDPKDKGDYDTAVEDLKEKFEKDFFESNNKNLIENKINKATFYIGTAGAKVGGRGGTARNILFSECAFYQDTDLITAREIVEGSSQQVPQGKGMIFIESTANGEGNYYQETWEKAERGDSIYKPRFFGWQEFYTEEWVLEKKKEFSNEKMWKQEYPYNAEEAFITSGTPYFDAMILDAMLKESPDPIEKGKFAPDGYMDLVYGDADSMVNIYREPQYGEQFVVFADPADSNDYCAAVAFSKKHYDAPVVFNAQMASSQFGYELHNFCKYIFNKTGMWPKLAVERNTGQATIYVLKELNYPDLFRMVDFSSQKGTYEKGGIGWVTTGHISGGELQGTRRKMLDDLALAVKQGQVKLYDKTQIKQLKKFMIVKGRAQAASNVKDDLVMATAGSWQVHLVTPDNTFSDWDAEEFAREKEKWRFK